MGVSSNRTLMESSTPFSEITSSSRVCGTLGNISFNVWSCSCINVKHKHVCPADGCITQRAEPVLKVKGVATEELLSTKQR